MIYLAESMFVIVLGGFERYNLIHGHTTDRSLENFIHNIVLWKVVYWIPQMIPEHSRNIFLCIIHVVWPFFLTCLDYHGKSYLYTFLQHTELQSIFILKRKWFMKFSVCWAYNFVFVWLSFHIYFGTHFERNIF